MTRSCRRSDFDQGFSLIELMVVMLIILILLGIALATFFVTTASANAAACRYNQRVLNDASAVAHCTVDAEPIDELGDLQPFVKNFGSVSKCPSDGTTLQLEVASGTVFCPNHP